MNRKRKALPQLTKKNYILFGNYLTNRKLKIFNSIDDQLITVFLKNESVQKFSNVASS